LLAKSVFNQVSVSEADVDDICPVIGLLHEWIEAAYHHASIFDKMRDRTDEF
jgi:hypothetical protein